MEWDVMKVYDGKDVFPKNIKFYYYLHDMLEWERKPNVLEFGYMNCRGWWNIEFLYGLLIFMDL